MQLNETSRRQKAIQSLNMKNKRVRTISIMTSENPMGSRFSKKENLKLRQELEEYLADRFYAWFPVKGKYGVDEKSYIIYNISLEDVLEIGKMFNQESIIFVEKDENEALYQYWEKEKDGDYKLKHSRTHYLEMGNAKDLYTQISRNFKFQIPFFDGSDENKDTMNEQINYLNEVVQERIKDENSIDYKIEKTLESNRTLSSKYRHRGSLYGRRFGRKAMQ